MSVVRLLSVSEVLILTTTSFGSALVIRLSSQYTHLPRDLINEVSNEPVNHTPTRRVNQKSTHSARYSNFQNDS